MIHSSSSKEPTPSSVPNQLLPQQPPRLPPTPPQGDIAAFDATLAVVSATYDTDVPTDPSHMEEVTSIWSTSVYSSKGPHTSESFHSERDHQSHSLGSGHQVTQMGTDDLTYTTEEG